MYQLLVFFPEKAIPDATINVPHGVDILHLMPNILAEYEGCAHVVVVTGGTRLFAIDCAGNRIP